MIYLDNAATSWHKPESMYQTTDEYMRKKAGGPDHSSHSTIIAAPEAVEEARMIMACFLKLDEK